MSARWSYKAIEVKVQLFGKALTERAREALDRAGQQGWELVSAVPSKAMGSLQLFLKKEA